MTRSQPFCSHVHIYRHSYPLLRRYVEKPNEELDVLSEQRFVVCRNYLLTRAYNVHIKVNAFDD